MTLSIANLDKQHIPMMVNAFALLGWQKPASLFENYLHDQQQGNRVVWVAFIDGQFSGYVTLKLHSAYTPFLEKAIPEINDLNVLPHFRNRGVASHLLDLAEAKAKTINDIVGIGVGLTADYGAAQRLYVKRGYMPNGRGITYANKEVHWGTSYVVDDDLVLWFSKKC